MLYDLDAAVLEWFRSHLSNIDPKLGDLNRMFISLVDDEYTHFRQYEQKTGAPIDLPFVVLFRDVIEMSEIFHYSASPATEQYVVTTKDTDPSSPEYGTAKVAKALPVQIPYKIILYDDSFKYVSDVTEAWMLAGGHTYTAFNYTSPQFTGEGRASIVLGPPESVRRTQSEFDTGGLVYTQAFPFMLHTYIVGPEHHTKIILNPVYHIIIIPPDESDMSTSHLHDTYHP